MFHPEAEVNDAACGVAVRRARRLVQTAPVDVYLEIGAKRAFAGAVEWPGWSRSARDESQALETLLAYAPRYAGVMRRSSPAFVEPSADDLVVVQRVTGDATTDFGAPSIAPEADRRDVDSRELVRLQALLEMSWEALDRAAAWAADRQLSRGPRGGGRDLDAIVSHVVAAEASYVRRIAGPSVRVDRLEPSDASREVRTTVQESLGRAVLEGLPEAGPRGGEIWPPRYFVRRAAWHVLDHAWEIEDRAGAGEETGAGRRPT
jgi:hypothetical protein